MEQIIFGIPAKRMPSKEILLYAAFVIQKAPSEKGKAFKMQLSDPAILLMGLNLDVKSSIAIASLGDRIFLVVVNDDNKELIPDKDICMVYSDGSVSSKRLYMYLTKLFKFDNTVKNTLLMERVMVNNDVPGLEPVIMYKLTATSLEASNETITEGSAVEEFISEDNQDSSIPERLEDILDSPSSEASGSITDDSSVTETASRIDTGSEPFNLSTES